MIKSNIKIPCAFCHNLSESAFGDLSREDLEQLTLAKTCIRYKKGQTLFYEGTRPLGIFCINTGKVKVYKISSDGKEQILYLSKPGDYLGYRAL